MILVTGINGFVGKHLARGLTASELRVVGVGQKEAQADKEISSLLKSYHQCDITDDVQVSRLPLEDINAIVNLAGLAAIGPSFDNPELYMQVNTSVLSVLGEAYYSRNPRGRIIAVSSGSLYDPNQKMPLNEMSKTRKNSPYAESKLAMERVAADFASMGFDCIVARPFNHIGPGQGPGFLLPDLVTKLKNFGPDSPEITAGNLKTVRDYTDVRDIAQAYVSLATSQNLKHRLYNICSGSGKSGEDMVKELCRTLDVDYAKLTIKTDPTLIRPSDPKEIIGDNSLLHRDTGWTPRIPLAQTVNDIVSSL